MIDIDEIYRLAKKAMEDPYGQPMNQVLDNFGNFRCAITPDEIEDIITRLRQSEKDAARYRWLRDESAFTHGNAPLAFFTDINGDQITFDFDGSSYSVLHDEMLDAAIDEAMQCGGEENDHASEESRVDLEGLMFDLGNYKAMLGRAENVLFEAERVLVEYQKNGGIEFDDLIGEIAYYVKYMSKGECSDS